MDINQSWNSTCKTVFGQEIGDLSKFKDYLKEAVPGKSVFSSFSQRPLFVGSGEYPMLGRYFDDSAERALVEKQNQPFKLDQIKDIDTLTSTLKERFVYGANKTQGRCEEIQSSDFVVDSINVLGSAHILRGKNIAYSYKARDCESIFGSTAFGYGANAIRAYYNKGITRVFECTTCETITDSLFCYQTFNSSDCMFCFNSRNRRHCVANVQLSKEQYAKLKSTLLEQIVGELTRKGRLDFSTIELV